MELCCYEQIWTVSDIVWWDINSDAGFRDEVQPGLFVCVSSSVNILHVQMLKRGVKTEPSQGCVNTSVCMYVCLEVRMRIVKLLT